MVLQLRQFLDNAKSLFAALPSGQVQNKIAKLFISPLKQVLFFTVPQLSIKGHVRRPSTVSVASTNSSTSGLSDSDSEAGSGNENDSGIEEVVQEECRTERIAHDFQRHLAGLTSSIRQMTEAAQYLTWRYQHDIGGPV